MSSRKSDVFVSLLALSVPPPSPPPPHPASDRSHALHLSLPVSYWNCSFVSCSILLDNLVVWEVLNDFCVSIEGSSGNVLLPWAQRPRVQGCGWQRASGRCHPILNMTERGCTSQTEDTKKTFSGPTNIRAILLAPPTFSMSAYTACRK